MYQRLVVNLSSRCQEVGNAHLAALRLHSVPTTLNQQK